MNRKHYTLVVALLWAGVVPCGESTTVTTREEADQAARIAADQMQIPSLRGYLLNALNPVTEKVLEEGVRQCRNVGKPPTSGYLVYVLILDTEGAVTKVIGVRETPFRKCLAEAIENGKYPAPPSAPFYSLLNAVP